MLERDAAKTALDLNLANAEFQNLSAQVTERERRTFGFAGGLLSQRRGADRSAAALADLQLEQERTRGRLASQAQQIGAMEQRLAQGETESQELEKRHAQLRQELEAHLQSLESWRRRSSRRASAARPSRPSASSPAGAAERARDARDRAAERSAVAGRIVGAEKSAGADRRISSAIDRDAARCQRDEQTAGADLERHAAVKAELSRRMSAAADGAGIHRGPTAARGRRAERTQGAGGEARKLLDQLRTDASRLKARKDSLEEILSHRAYTAESVKRLFTAIERGEAEELHAAGVLADFVEVEPVYEKATEEFLHEELEYVVVDNWNDAERGIDLMRTDLDGRATFLVHPEAGEQARAAGTACGRRRRDRPVERSSAVHQWLCECPARSAAAAGALFPGERSRRRRSGWRWRIRSSSSFCRMASAITATR